MNKRIICLLIAMLMVLACFAGCGKKSDEELQEDIEKEASASTATLSMYLMSEAPVSAEQAAKIEQAVNKITKAKFKTQLKLTFLTEDQYYTVLEENISQQKQNKGKRPSNSKGNSETTEAETVWNENLGTFELKYPTIENYQVDMFYFDGQARFDKYIENGYLSVLDEAISSTSKSIKQYIDPEFLTHMKSVAGATYALPSYRPVGEYTYMLVNKEALDLTEYSADYFSSLTDENCQDFLKMIAENKEYSDKFVPIYSTTGKYDAITGIQFWGVDENGNLSDNFSVIGGYIDESKVYKQEGAAVDPINLLAPKSKFIEQFKVLKYYDHAGYYNDAAVEDKTKNFAIGYMKGDAELVEQYKDEYEIIVVDTPVIKTADMFDDMFGVSAYTSSVSRSMEILTYLNTNKDFRNLILYGIEGENYELVDSEIKDVNGDYYLMVERPDKDERTYDISASKTGNMLLAYPEIGETANRVEYYKKQNNDAIVSQIMGYRLNYDGIAIDIARLQNVRVLSEKIYKELVECPYDELDAKITEKYKETTLEEYPYAADVAFHIGKTSNLDSNGSVDPQKLASLGYSYYKWKLDMKIYIPEK
jgi:hypothetical protein